MRRIRKGVATEAYWAGTVRERNEAGADAAALECGRIQEMEHLAPGDDGDDVDRLPVLHPVVFGEEPLPLGDDHRGGAHPRLGEEVHHPARAREFEFLLLLSEANGDHGWHYTWCVHETVESPGGGE